MTDQAQKKGHLVVPVEAVDRDAMASSIADFLTASGLPDAAVSGAPQKTAEAWAEILLAGYREDPATILGQSWPDQTGELVTMLAVPFVSVCEHHLLPFYGEAHLAYLPDGQLTGLSRLAALVDCLARRLQVQERLTEQLVDVVMDSLKPKGAACVLEAVHDCVGARTLQHRGSRVQTVAYRGEFRNDPGLQDRLLRLVLGGGVAGR
jgi:GTP cyclohydrolase I